MNPPPRVTVCLPVRNAEPFLAERIRSIADQTVPQFEVVALDGQSTDGSWPRLQHWAAHDPRVRLHQEPPRGIYQAINRCLDLAQGETIYVATADDAMEPMALEKLLRALDRNPDCGIAQCALRITSDAPGCLPWERYGPARYLGSWRERPHRRRHPHDGLLHFGVYTVFTSLTQILVRSRVVREVGPFPTDCGSFGDFEWGLRCGATTDVTYVPEALATWRRHDRQATSDWRVEQGIARGDFLRMARRAVRWISTRDPANAQRWRRTGMWRFLVQDRWRRCSVHPGPGGAWRWGAAWARLRNPQLRQDLGSRCLGRGRLALPPMEEVLRADLKGWGVATPLEPVAHD